MGKQCVCDVTGPDPSCSAFQTCTSPSNAVHYDSASCCYAVLSVHLLPLFSDMFVVLVSIQIFARTVTNSRSKTYASHHFRTVIKCAASAQSCLSHWFSLEKNVCSESWSFYLSHSSQTYWQLDHCFHLKANKISRTLGAMKVEYTHCFERCWFYTVSTKNWYQLVTATWTWALSLLYFCDIVYIMVPLTCDSVCRGWCVTTVRSGVPTV